MAGLSRLPRKQQAAAAARRGLVIATLLLGGVLLVSLLHRNGSLHASGGPFLAEGDVDVAARMFQISQETNSLTTFVERLQKAGLMAGGISSSGGSGSGKADTEPSGSGSGSSGGDSDDGIIQGDAPGTAAAGTNTSTTTKSAATGLPKPAKRLPVPQLSRELAHKHARDGIVIVTWANSHFYDFVLNWVHHMRVHDISNYMVGAMDDDIGQALAAAGLNVFAMYDEQAGEGDTGLGKGDFGWGSANFHKMGRQKVDLARTFTGYGLDLCLCDVDTVWIIDPTDYFERYPQADILASSDHLYPTNPKGDDGLDQPEAIHSAMNIGLLFFRHGKNTTHFIDAWQAKLDADDKAWDQNVFNEVAHDGLLPFQRLPDSPRLVWGTNNSLAFGVLPASSFASGHTFFVQRLFEYQKVLPYVVHTTFQYGGTSGKRHRLREAMLWVDPPEYYSDGLFLSVDLQYPENPAGFQLQNETMLEGIRFKTTWETNDMVEFHLKAMEQQLKQMRHALKLAVLLNRTIIMPKLLSWCDRYWGPVEYCQVPGAFSTRLPFVAPMDHIFEPFNFNDVDTKGGGDMGPPIQFREYSFLANERTPKSLKESRLVIRPSAGVHKAELRKGKDGQKVLHIPQRLSEVKLREALAPHTSDIKVLHFSSLEGATGKIEDYKLKDRFQMRLYHMMGFFCCKNVKEGDDGGFAYGKFVKDQD